MNVNPPDRLVAHLVGALCVHRHYGVTHLLEDYDALVMATLQVMQLVGGQVLLVLPEGTLLPHCLTLVWRACAERLVVDYPIGTSARPVSNPRFHVLVSNTPPDTSHGYSLVVVVHRPDTPALLQRYAAPVLWVSTRPYTQPRVDTFNDAAVAKARAWHLEQWLPRHAFERTECVGLSAAALENMHRAPPLVPSLAHHVSSTKLDMLEWLVCGMRGRDCLGRVVFLASSDAMVRWVAAALAKLCTDWPGVAVHSLVRKCHMDDQRAAVAAMWAAPQCLLVAFDCNYNTPYFVSRADTVVVADPFVQDAILLALHDCSAAIDVVQLRVALPMDTLQLHDNMARRLFGTADGDRHAHRKDPGVALRFADGAELTLCTPDTPVLSFGALLEAVQRHGAAVQLTSAGRKIGQPLLLHCSLLHDVDALLDGDHRAFLSLVTRESPQLHQLAQLCDADLAGDAEARSRFVTFLLCKLILDEAGVYALFVTPDRRLLCRSRGANHQLGQCAPPPLLAAPDESVNLHEVYSECVVW